MSEGATEKTQDNPSQSIRFIRDDEADQISYIAIDTQKELYRFMSPVKPSRLELYSQAPSSGEDDMDEPWNLIAVTDKNDRMVAWIQFTVDSPRNIRLINKEFPIDVNEESDEESLVLESASAKLFNHNISNVTLNNNPLYADQDFKPNMVEARIKAEEKLVNMEKQISDSLGKNPRSIYITAYTDPENIPSEVNLKKAGYTLLNKKIKYEKTDTKKSNVWIKKLN